MVRASRAGPRSSRSPHATPLADLLAVVARRRQVTRLHPVRRSAAGIAEATCCPASRIAGAAVFAEEVLADGAQALVY